MDIRQQNVPVTMIRADLADLPTFPLPEGYSIRAYQPGDEQAWVAIHKVADLLNEITPELYQAQFGTDQDLLAKRQFFLLDSQENPVGTASAWFNNNFNGQRYGQVHWVAIRPEHQGRGLAKPLLGKVCCTLRDLGHDKAYLGTSTARIPAINLYRKFGFSPLIRDEKEKMVWKRLEGFLG